MPRFPSPAGRYGSAAAYPRSTTKIIASYAGDLLWVVLAILLAGIIAVFYARQVTNPIDELRATTRRIAAGELGARSPEQGPAEVVELSRSVNAMADALQRSLNTPKRVGPPWNDPSQNTPRLPRAWRKATCLHA